MWDKELEAICTLIFQIEEHNHKVFHDVLFKPEMENEDWLMIDYDDALCKFLGIDPREIITDGFTVGDWVVEERMGIDLFKSVKDVKDYVIKIRSGI